MRSLNIIYEYTPLGVFNHIWLSVHVLSMRHVFNHIWLNMCIMCVIIYIETSRMILPLYIMYLYVSAYINMCAYTNIHKYKNITFYLHYFLIEFSWQLNLNNNYSFFPWFQAIATAKMRGEYPERAGQPECQVGGIM